MPRRSPLRGSGFSARLRAKRTAYGNSPCAKTIRSTSLAKRTACRFPRQRRFPMGRTVPTFRQLIEEAAERWSKFRRALRREDQEHFDRLFHRARCYTQAATYQCNDNPMEAILLSLALDQEKRLHALEQLAQPKENSHAIPEAVPSPTQGSIAEPDEGPIQIGRAHV